jgi:uncharacterized protein (TIGR02453 family)
MLNKKQIVFTGFSPETLEFLKNLERNNNKVWFETHRQEYQHHLLEPFQGLVQAMGAFMLTLDPWLEITPAIDRTISRIYRDTRFAKDKSPYKTTMWLTFKRPNKDWKDAPAYFFEIASSWYHYGMGFYSASKATMDQLREAIDTQPDEFLDAISFYAQQQVFVVEGEQYKKLLDASKPEAIQEWYQRKNLYLVCKREADQRLFNKKLVEELQAGFRMLAPLYHFLGQICTRIL